MDWQQEFKKRPIIVSLIAMLAAAILMEVMWGLAAGIGYGLTGFLGGFFARVWLLAAGIPIWSLLTNNPVVRFEWVVALPMLEKSTVFLVSLAVCALAAFFGAGVGRRRSERKPATAS